MATNRETYEPEQEDPPSPVEDEAQAVSRAPQLDGGKKAIIALIFCAIQQIPVWGLQTGFGAVQQYETQRGNIKGDQSTIGIVGTTMNGIIYISMPFVSAFLARYQSLSRLCCVVGALITASSLVCGAFATEVWHLICALGILNAVGASILYISTMMILNTWFAERKGLAFAVTLSTKALVGSITPIMFAQLLDRIGYRYTMLIWAGIVFVVGTPVALLLYPQRSTQTLSFREARPQRMPWSVLKNGTAWSFIVAAALFSAGYGLPQTYIASYASQVLDLSPTLSSAMLTVLAALSVPASLTFGILGEGNFRIRGRRINVHVVSAFASINSALCALLLWGFSSNTAVLVLFSIMYGFFAGGYSAIFSGVMKEVARERPSSDDSATGLIFGLLNGGRGIGFVVGGLIGARLLESEPVDMSRSAYGYGSSYAAMILFTGITCFFGGSNVLWKAASVIRR